MTSTPMSKQEADLLPPTIVGYEIESMRIVGERRNREFFCLVHRPHVEWPTELMPIWRGEIPVADASCEKCGLYLRELE